MKMKHPIISHTYITYATKTYSLLYNIRPFKAVPSSKTYHSFLCESHVIHNLHLGAGLIFACLSFLSSCNTKVVSMQYLRWDSNPCIRFALSLSLAALPLSYSSKNAKSSDLTIFDLIKLYRKCNKQFQVLNFPKLLICYLLCNYKII